MSEFLPPILVELRANGAQAITEMGKVAAAAEASTAKMKAAAEKEAAAARDAADKANKAAQEKVAAAERAAQAQQVAADKAAEAQVKAAAAAKAAQEAQAKAAATGAEEDVAAAEKKVAAAEKAAVGAENAANREAKATQTAAKAAQDAQKAKELSYAADQRAVDAMAAAHETSATRVSNAWQGVKKTADTIAGFTIAGAGLVAGAAIKMAADFEKETTLLVTAGGESKAALGSVRDGILNIATETGTSTSQLAEGMYVMEKAGYHGADGLKVLAAAAEGAKAEGVDLQTMTQAVTDILLDYGKGADQAVSVTNGLVSASGLAKTTMQDFASSMAAIVPTASVAGLSFAQVGGAIATMTQHGESAQQSSQNLANLLTQMERPSNIASKAMQQMGIDVTDLSQHLGDENGGRGLLGSLQMVDQHIKEHMGADGLIVQSTMNKSQTAAQDLQKIIAQMPPDLAKLSQGFLDGTVSQKEYMKGYKDMSGSASVLGGQFMSLAKSTLGVNDLLKSGNPALMTYAGMWNRAAGGITGARTALMLLMNNSQQFEDNIAAIQKAEDQNGQHIATWADTQKTFAVQLDMTVQSAQKLGIELGAKLLPAAKDLLGGVSDLFHGFEQGNPLLIATAGALGTITALVVAGKLIGGLMNIGKTFLDVGKQAATGIGDFVSGFRNAEAAASSFTGKMGSLGGAVKGALPMLGGIAGVAGAATVALQLMAATTEHVTIDTDKMRKALVDLSDSGSSIGKMELDQQFTQWDKSMGIAVTGVDNLDDAVQKFTHQDFFSTISSGIDGMRAQLGFAKSDAGQFGDRFKAIGDQLGQMVKGGSVDVAAKDFDQLAESFVKNGKTAQDALDTMPGYSQALKDAAASAGIQLSKEELLEAAMGKVPDSMKQATQATGDYVDAAGKIQPITPALQKSLDDAGISADGLVTDLDKVRSGMEADGLAVVNARDAQSRMNQSMDDAKKTMDDFVNSGHKVGEGLNANKTDFDLTTEAGRQLNDKYEAVMKSGEDMANSVKGTGVDAQKQVQDALNQTYQHLVDAGHEMGITGSAADDLARNVMGIPPGVDIHTWMDSYAKDQADKTTAAINAIPDQKIVDIVINTTDNTGGGQGAAGNVAGVVHANASGGFQAFAGGGAVGGYPRGGLLKGPGTGISDSMLARVSNGEFIIRAAMVQKYGLDTFTAFNNGSIEAAPGSSSAQGAWNGRSSGGGNQYINVTAQTNATGPQIASEVGWALRNQN